MWRDRTNLYVSYRQSYTHHPTTKWRHPHDPDRSSDKVEESRALIASAWPTNGDAVVEMDVLPPRWLDIQEQVISLIQMINAEMRKVEPLHSKHVLPGFEDDVVKKVEEREIEQITQNITRGFQSCQKAIRRIESMRREAQQQGTLSKSEEAMAKNLQVSLAARVGEVSALFRKKQSGYLKKLRQLNGMASPLERSLSPSRGSYTDPLILESDADRSFSQATLQQTARKRRSDNEEAIEHREKAIEEIAQGIIELANIFQELQTMVIDQGTILDRIDFNIERMASDVKAADTELRTATGYQKRSTKRKIMLLLVLLVVGLLILLILKPRKSQSDSDIVNMPLGRRSWVSKLVNRALSARVDIRQYTLDPG